MKRDSLQTVIGLARQHSRGAVRLRATMRLGRTIPASPTARVMDRTTKDGLILFALGAATVSVGMLGGGLLLLVLPIGTALLAGRIEAQAAQRTGRRRWVMAWLPAVLGMGITLAMLVMAGPQGPDSGLAAGIVVMAFAVVAPVFAALVLLVGWFTSGPLPEALAQGTTL